MQTLTSLMESPDRLIGTIPLVLAIGAGLSGIRLGRRARGERNRTVAGPEKALADRIQRLSSTAVLAKVLADEISAEVALIEGRASRLTEEAERARVLSELNEKHREAMAAALRVELQDDSKRRKWSSFWSAALWFVAGVAASVATTLFVHPL